MFKLWMFFKSNRCCSKILKTSKEQRHVSLFDGLFVRAHIQTMLETIKFPSFSKPICGKEEVLIISISQRPPNHRPILGGQHKQTYLQDTIRTHLLDTKSVAVLSLNCCCYIQLKIPCVAVWGLCVGDCISKVSANT